MHPPSWPNACGEHPGLGWDLNSQGTQQYYRLLIRNPLSDTYIVAPYVTYSLNRANPEISGTFGRGYPIITHQLRPTPVDYICPPLTPDQLRLLDDNTPYVDAINSVINNYLPYDVSYGIRQYQYFKEKQYATQRRIKLLQEQEMQYLEKSMEVLSELENANVVGRILCHEEIIADTIRDSDPLALIPFQRVANSFHGDITQSATDTRINKDSTNDRYRRLGKIVPYPAPTRPEQVDLPWWKKDGYITMRAAIAARNRNRAHRTDIDDVLTDAASDIEDRLRASLHERLKENRVPRPGCVHRIVPVRASTLCFSCKGRGHIRKDCPRRFRK
jgi:hypothetical protein